MKPIDVLIAAGEITKTGTLTTTYNKLTEGSNPYDQFGYGPLTICKHTQRKVSVSINYDSINMIHTSQQSTKEGLNK